MYIERAHRVGVVWRCRKITCLKAQLLFCICFLPPPPLTKFYLPFYATLENILYHYFLYLLSISHIFGGGWGKTRLLVAQIAAVESEYAKGLRKVVKYIYGKEWEKGGKVISGKWCGGWKREIWQNFISLSDQTQCRCGCSRDCTMIG